MGKNQSTLPSNDDDDEQSNTSDVVVKTKIIIPDKLSFVFLDQSIDEYANFRNQFCEKTGCQRNLWARYDNVDDVKSLIKSIILPSKILLVSSGRLCTNIIREIHDLAQLHSVYVYCQDLPTYESLRKEYAKVRDISDTSDLLIIRIRNDLVEEMTPLQPLGRRPRTITAEATMSQSSPTPHSIAERAKEAATPPKHDRAANEEGVEYFYQPGIHWCPWGANSCSKTLVVKGQGTVAIMELEPMPFELCLSNRQDPNDQNASSIILTVDTKEARLCINNKIYDMSHVPHHLIQPNNGKWHQYWLSLFKDTRTVRYGLGEIRSLFTIFQISIDEKDANAFKDIFYLHVKLNNNDQMLSELGVSREKFRFFIGKDAVTYDPPLLVASQDKVDLKDIAKHQTIASSNLEKPCRQLYNSVINLTLNDSDFPDLTNAIERSVRSPNGWCRQKLIGKANKFGRPNLYATYLRLTIGDREGTAPGHSYVVEIWPPGHYSPVHNHSNAYGIIKVLYGRLLIKLYPELALNVRQHSPIETILEAGQVTWMLPKLNQTHQVRNPDMYDKCCITIQCYQYGYEDREHYEYFDYLNNDGQSMGQFDPKSDIDFFDFRKIMRDEWEHPSTI